MPKKKDKKKVKISKEQVEDETGEEMPTIQNMRIHQPNPNSPGVYVKQLNEQEEMVSRRLVSHRSRRDSVLDRMARADTPQPSTSTWCDEDPVMEIPPDERPSSPGITRKSLRMIRIPIWRRRIASETRTKMERAIEGLQYWDSVKARQKMLVRKILLDDSPPDNKSSCFPFRHRSQTPHLPRHFPRLRTRSSSPTIYYPDLDNEIGSSMPKSGSSITLNDDGDYMWDDIRPSPESSFVQVEETPKPTTFTEVPLGPFCRNYLLSYKRYKFPFSVVTWPTKPKRQQKLFLPSKSPLPSVLHSSTKKRRFFYNFANKISFARATVMQDIKGYETVSLAKAFMHPSDTRHSNKKSPSGSDDEKSSSPKSSTSKSSPPQSSTSKSSPPQSSTSKSSPPQSSTSKSSPPKSSPSKGSPVSSSPKSSLSKSTRGSPKKVTFSNTTDKRPSQPERKRQLPAIPQQGPPSDVHKNRRSSYSSSPLRSSEGPSTNVSSSPRRHSDIPKQERRILPPTPERGRPRDVQNLPSTSHQSPVRRQLPTPVNYPLFRGSMPLQNPPGEGTYSQYPSRGSRPFQDPTEEGTSFQYPLRDGRPFQNPPGESMPSQYSSRDSRYSQNPTGQSTFAQYSSRDSRPFQNPPGEGAILQYSSRDGRPFQNPTGEGMSSHYPSRDSRHFQNPTGKGTFSHYPLRDSRHFQNPTGEYTSSQYSSIDSRHFQNPTGEGTSSQYQSRDSRHFQNPTGEGTSSQYQSRDSRHFQNPTGEGTSSQYQSRDSRNFQNPTGEGTSSHYPSRDSRHFPNPTGEGTSSQYQSRDSRHFPNPTGEGTSSQYPSRDHGYFQNPRGGSTSSQSPLRVGRSPRNPTERDTSSQSPSRSGRYISNPTEGGTSSQSPLRAARFIPNPTNVGTSSQSPSRSGRYIPNLTEAGTSSQSPLRAGRSFRNPTEEDMSCQSPRKRGRFLQNPREGGTTSQSPPRISRPSQIPPRGGKSSQNPSRDGSSSSNPSKDDRTEYYVNILTVVTSQDLDDEQLNNETETVPLLSSTPRIQDDELADSPVDLNEGLDSVESECVQVDDRADNPVDLNKDLDSAESKCEQVDELPDSPVDSNNVLDSGESEYVQVDEVANSPVDSNKGLDPAESECVQSPSYSRFTLQNIYTTTMVRQFSQYFRGLYLFLNLARQYDLVDDLYNLYDHDWYPSRNHNPVRLHYYTPVQPNPYARRRSFWEMSMVSPLLNSPTGYVDPDKSPFKYFMESYRHDLQFAFRGNNFVNVNYAIRYLEYMHINRSSIYPLYSLSELLYFYYHLWMRVPIPGSTSFVPVNRLLDDCNYLHLDPLTAVRESRMFSEDAIMHFMIDHFSSIELDPFLCPDLTGNYYTFNDMNRLFLSMRHWLEAPTVENVSHRQSYLNLGNILDLTAHAPPDYHYDAGLNSILPPEEEENPLGMWHTIWTLIFLLSFATVCLYSTYYFWDLVLPIVPYVFFAITNFLGMISLPMLLWQLGRRFHRLSESVGRYLGFVANLFNMRKHKKKTKGKIRF